MKKITLADATLCNADITSFKEKTETARLLDKIGVDIIELAELSAGKADALLVKTVCTLVKSAAVCVCASSADSIRLAGEALKGAKKSAIAISLPVSPTGMEYTCKKKPDKMLALIEEEIKLAKEYCDNVYFYAKDATRAEKEFLYAAVSCAFGAGATGVCVCDDAGVLMPDEFAPFVSDISEKAGRAIGICISDKNHLACAGAYLAVKAGAEFVRVCVGSKAGVSLEEFSSLVSDRSADIGICTSIVGTELHRATDQICAYIKPSGDKTYSGSTVKESGMHISLDKTSTKKDVSSFASMLGYLLSDEDIDKVHEEILRMAEKKTIGEAEFDAVIASTAMQVPAQIKLISYVINTGNLTPASAQITVSINGENKCGICIGDGPIDAAFLAMEQIVGDHYELDDFRIKSVTEGREAVGSALVKLRSNGSVYSGSGISTDIIGASIRAYISALNKILYEEARA